MDGPVTFVFLEWKCFVHSSEIPLVFAAMTVAQFKAFKKALATLRRAGVPFDESITVLLGASQQKWIESCRPTAVRHGS
jgi:type II secretory pathway component PulF